MRSSWWVVFACCSTAACGSSGGATGAQPAVVDAGAGGVTSPDASSVGGSSSGGKSNTGGATGSGGVDASTTDGPAPSAGGSGAAPEAGTRVDGGSCVASDLNPAATVGCNGPVPGPQAAGTNGGSCETACGAGLTCAPSGSAPGLCVTSCDPAATYVSGGNCPAGYRCFTLTPTLAYCLPDCTSGADCSSGTCTTDGACAFPINGPDGAVSTCIAGGPCQNGNGNGLCDGLACNPCNDPADDAKCAAIYGAGTLCLNGVCAPSSCRSSSDCAGKPCTNDQCTPCTSDGQCTTAGTICNTTTGACVTNASCGSAADNAACPVNSGDVCCSAVCLPGKCCGSGPCTVKTANDGTCAGGECQLNTCAAPPSTTRYIDPAAAAGGNGSKTCPYVHIGSATSDLAASGGTIVFKGGTKSTFTGSSQPAAGITVVGSDSNFDPCTETSADSLCTVPANWAAINETSVYDAFASNSAPGARTFRYLQLTAIAGTNNSYGIDVNPTTGTSSVTVAHLRISGFKAGFRAANGGTVNIGADVQSTGNTFTGLYVTTLGVADVELKAGDAHTSFSSNTNTTGNNTFGIYVEGSGKLTVNGPSYPAASLVFAEKNKYGVRFASTTSGSSITGLAMSNNTSDGLYLYAKSILKVRGSYFTSNGGDGVRVVANGTNAANGLTAIDFGTTDAGKNTFKANTNTGLCVDAAVALAATNKSLNAQGNYWATTCTAAAPTGNIKISGTCGPGIDESADCSGAVNASTCTIKFVDPGGVCVSQ